MKTKYFFSVLMSILCFSVVFGQKIKCIEGQLQKVPSSWELQRNVIYYYLPRMPFIPIESFSELKSEINQMDSWPQGYSQDGSAYDQCLNGYDSNNKLIIDCRKKVHFEVFDDRWEITNTQTNKKLVICFADLQNQNLRVIVDYKRNQLLELKNMWFEGNDLYWLATNLYVIQYFIYEKPKIDKAQDSIRVADSNQFSSLATKYREMKEKLLVTEEQRKYIVQANSFTKDKFYTKAI